MNSNLPLLVRGKTGTPADDHKRVAELVAEAMRDLGWRDVDRSRITVKNLGGQGMGKTLKISAPGVEPEAVVLHSRGGGDPIIEATTAECAQLFASHGLAPERLAQGGDWWIEPFAGCCVG